MKTQIIFLCFLAYLFSSEAERPKIVLIMADIMEYSDDLLPYVGEIKTPNLESLAENRMGFSQGYYTSKCLTTHISLLTRLDYHRCDRNF
jgi:arylsulfatase